MSEALIRSILAEIQTFKDGERNQRLTWSHLVEFSGFSQVSLWKKPLIKAAFVIAQHAQRKTATPPIKKPRTSDERVVALEAKINDQNAIIREYDERWALYVFNVARLGIQFEELERPLNPTYRKVIRARTV